MTDSEILNFKDHRIMMILRATNIIKEVSGWLNDLTLRSPDAAFTERVNRIRKSLEDVIMKLREEVSVQEKIILADIAPLDKLPPDVQPIMRMRLVYGYSITDICDMLDITEKEANDLYHTGVNLLFNVTEADLIPEGIQG